MTLLDPSDAETTTTESPSDPRAVMAALRQAGAAQWDPVRLHYLQVVLQRADGETGRVKELLQSRLSNAVAAYQARFERALNDARNAVTNATSTHPQAAAELQKRLDAGDCKGVTQFLAALQQPTRRNPLGELRQYIAQQTTDGLVSHADVTGGLGQPPELKTSRVFRNTWSKLSVDRQVAQALDQAPKNAGPINSHMLVLQALTQMRDISPDYLNRFTSYVDTLLALDQAEVSKPVPVKKAAPRAAAKSAKPAAAAKSTTNRKLRVVKEK
ncbi:MAG: DUF2894 domain-containing protein [Rhodoferax sp.]|nr:DUF2894 domain-containing protein [Rhodoferax sp.]MBP7493060.1 DUF2894 domain-containing protein [Rhodoferax sp.]